MLNPSVANSAFPLSCRIDPAAVQKIETDQLGQSKAATNNSLIDLIRTAGLTTFRLSPFKCNHIHFSRLSSFGTFRRNSIGNSATPIYRSKVLRVSLSAKGKWPFKKQYGVVSKSFSGRRKIN